MPDGEGYAVYGHYVVGVAQVSYKNKKLIHPQNRRLARHVYALLLNPDKIAQIERLAAYRVAQLPE
jgi:hypothetical protein